MSAVLEPSRTPALPLAVDAGAPPPLENGAHLSRSEFERRYAAMPDARAELIEGVVYMSSPVSVDHGEPLDAIITWLGVYRAATPGLRGGTDLTVRLDAANEVQPDAQLRFATGGRSRVSDDRYVEGAPDLVVEVAATTASIDLHGKRNAYRRNGVREYLVVRTRDRAVDWFAFDGGDERRLAPASDGTLRSEVFPGLWLDPAALLRDDVRAVIEPVQRGIATEEHARFVARPA